MRARYRLGLALLIACVPFVAVALWLMEFTLPRKAAAMPVPPFPFAPSTNRTEVLH